MRARRWTPQVVTAGAAAVFAVAWFATPAPARYAVAAVIFAAWLVALRVMSPELFPERQRDATAEAWRVLTLKVDELVATPYEQLLERERSEDRLIEMTREAGVVYAYETNLLYEGDRTRNVRVTVALLRWDDPKRRLVHVAVDDFIATPDGEILDVSG
jgi:hypothetical protein